MAAHPRRIRRRLRLVKSPLPVIPVRWVLSRIDVLDVTRDVGAQAAALLRAHRLRGHKYAIDAVLAAIARAAARPVTVLTSDPEDLTPLCGDVAEIVKI